jgi:hypothetical protein
MKNIIVIIFSICISPFAIKAQVKQNAEVAPVSISEKRTNYIMESLTGRLNLSPDQAQKLRPQILKTEKQREQLATTLKSMPQADAKVQEGFQLKLQNVVKMENDAVLSVLNEYQTMTFRNNKLDQILK